MDIQLSYGLAADVQLIAAKNLSDEQRRHLGLTDADVVITPRHSRKRSKAVSNELATLLKRFSAPQTVTEAIFQHAWLTGQDPQQLADAAFPVLQELAQEGYLVPLNAAEKPAWKNRLQPGEKFGSYLVKAVCQAYEDTVVYKAEDASGAAYALKIFRPSSSAPPPACENEKAILKKLDNTVNPPLVEHGVHEGSCYLLTQWCEGLLCEEAAARHHNFFSQKNVASLLRLCTAIARAYHHLHRQGVLHGDVHPANVLVEEGFGIKLIDYGSAVISGSLQRSLRGGVDFYYEPELAAALLQRKEAVPVTKKAEQYAVAALLYKLFTGHAYLSFSFEPEKAYRQIAEEPPFPFAAFDIAVPAVVETVFRKALAKNPADRYSSLAHFADALQGCCGAVEEEAKTFFFDGQKKSENIVRFLLQKYGVSQALIQAGLQRPPTCSVNYGAAGIAYFLYRAACALQDPVWLDAASVWAGHASVYQEDIGKAFYSAADGITEKTVGRRALYHSPTGVHVVQAMICNGRNDGMGLQQAVQDYLRTASVDCSQLDLALGKAGLLAGSALLLKELRCHSGMDTSPLILFANALLKELWEQLDALPLLKTENIVDYFGMAHGWGGLLYGSLLWCHTAGQALPQRLAARLDELLLKAKQHKEALRWPVSNRDKQTWLGWCHGNAGYVYLWSLAWQHFNKERFLSAAIQTGAALFHSRPQTANLCCGLAGEAYALLKLYQLTGEQRYRQQAEGMKQRMLRDLSSPDLRNHSLYKGEVGIGVLLCEMAQPELARMPLFE